MSKLFLTVRIPPDYNRQAWHDILSQVEKQVNSLSEGAIAGHYNAFTSAPNTSTYAQGDFVRNSKPTVLGTAPDTYIVFGWTCVASGTPGTWTECRFAVGNDTINPFVGSITFSGATPTVA